MSVRDRKLGVLSEALANIRQIKFSGHERQWQEKIRSVRNQELDTLWDVFIARVIVGACYLAGPILLSTVSLIVYTVIHRTLSPSVAFTAISVLSQIEGTLGSLPGVTTDVMDAWVACNRIQRYLDAPEKEKTTRPGPSVSFEKATITWPSYNDEEGEKYLLKDVNLTFPNGDLSVISGRTGSGKSLLLASILGEADLLSGTITVPEALPSEQRYDENANPSNWILPSTLAFVSQQPWIENRTFRENILFGLPYHEARYQKVIHACALDKDLELWEDGDMTEIGPNGINLSGGQRWRTTLARAVYSRAGILVLDDIFSAVDANVGKHIFEHALMGELSEKRTRILVTHHVSLCLPKTKYLVQVGEGKIDYAGPVEDAKSDLIDLAGSFHGEAGVETIPEDEVLETSGILEARLRRRSSVAHHQIINPLSRQSTLERRNSTLTERRSSVANSLVEAVSRGLEVATSKPVPRKFIEEETKDVGRVKWAVYRGYLDSTGGFWAWFVLIIGCCGYQGLQILRVSFSVSPQKLS